MLVTSESHPHIIKAFNCIEEVSSGRSFATPVREVPDRWKPFLDEINEAIGTLSQTERCPDSEPLPAHVKPDAYLDSEFYTFCNGEYHDQQRIENRSMALTRAAVLLNDFFEDFTYTGDSPKEMPENIIRRRRIEWLTSVENESATEPTPEQRDELERLRMELV
jgi:hypothetical protein